jgi:uncharacterized protein YlxP (DUF503 family)
LPWVNYELWSSIEKAKEAKTRNLAERKSEYLDLLRSQGIDVTKINMDSIVFDDEDDSESEVVDQEGQMEVIE